MDERSKDENHPGKAPAKDEEHRSPAGPHDKPHLTNPDNTPGAGSLPETKDGEADAGVG